MSEAETQIRRLNDFCHELEQKLVQAEDENMHLKEREGDLLQ